LKGEGVDLNQRFVGRGIPVASQQSRNALGFSAFPSFGWEWSENPAGGLGGAKPPINRRSP